METIEPITREEKEKLETTLNTKVKNLSEEVKEIKKKTNSLVVNNSPHGMATISTSLFIASYSFYQAGEYQKAALSFGAGLFAYMIQNVLVVLKIKIQDGNIADIQNENVVIRTIGEMTGFAKRK